MGPHCTVRPEHLLVALQMALTLEPIKSLCTLSTLRLVFFGRMVSLSHLQRTVPFGLIGGVLEYDTLWTGSLWHFGRRLFRKSLCLLTVPCEGLSSSDLVGVSNRLLRASNRAFLDVCGSQSDSSELLLLTPLTFSDLALAHLGGVLLLGGCSGMELLLICILHWSLLAAMAFC